MKNKHKTAWRIIILVVLVSMVIFTVLPALTFGADKLDYDVSVRSRGITFFPESFYADDTVRIYGTIENLGLNDMTGYAQFFQGPHLIATEIPFSSKASGAAEEVWVDWVAQEGAYNVQFSILGTTPQDQNLANNQTVSKAFTVAKRPPPPPEPEPTPEPTPDPIVTTPMPENTTTSTTTPITETIPANSNTATPVTAKKVDPRVLGQEKEMALVQDVIPQAIEESGHSSADPNGATITAVVPQSDYNKMQKPLISLGFLGDVDPYMLMLGGSVLLIFLLFILALVFWKKAKNTANLEDKLESEDQTAEETLKEFLDPYHKKGK